MNKTHWIGSEGDAWGRLCRVFERFDDIVQFARRSRSDIESILYGLTHKEAENYILWL